MKKTILVIEDNPLNMKLVRVLLGLAECAVLEATDAERGIGMARERKPDLILMDVQLPGMDGLEATRVIRREEAGTGGHTPIVAMTAHAMEEDRKLCMDAGMDDYVSKPIQAGLLRAVIDRHTGRNGRGNDDSEEIGTKDTPGREVFDREELLDALGGDNKCLTELVNSFIDDVSVQTGELQRALGETQMNEAVALAHRLKGAAANMRAKSMSMLFSNIEQAATRRDQEQAARLLEDVEEAFQVFRRVFSAGDQ